MSEQQQRILLLTLKTFSATGGIEKVCRIAGKALHENALNNGNNFNMFSMYDDAGAAAGNKYFPENNFRGFGARRLQFMYNAVKHGRRSDIVLLSHVNLLPAAWLINIFSGSAKTILIAHGIEVWRPLKSFKKKMLQKLDGVFCVSKYTSGVIQAVNEMPASKCEVLNNCLDPFLPAVQTSRDHQWMERYGLQNEDTVLFAVTRLAVTERHKGYDKVINGMAVLKDTYPRLRYLLVGKYTDEEKLHIVALAKSAGVEGQVVLAGFVADEDLAAHFSLADVYIMPSKKEGFGIVFIEALYYGLPVIAGNRDGSRDALADGKFGIGVDPDDQQEIVSALEQVLQNRQQYLPSAATVNAQFGFDTYKQKLNQLILKYTKINE